MVKIFPNINNNYSKSISSSRNSDMAVYSSDYCSDVNSYVDQWHRTVIPPINMSNQRILFNNNFNSSEKMKKSQSKKSSSNGSENEEQQSKVYFRNIMDNNKIYLLKFKTTDVVIQPVYLKPRVFEESELDKIIQPRCKKVFKTKYNIKAKRLCILHRSYTLDKKSDRISVMSNKKPLFKRKPLAAIPPKQKRPISHKSSSIDNSIIFLEVKNVKWELYPGVINIRAVKPIDYDNIEAKENMLKSLGMESTEAAKNKASFVVRHKKDVVKISFSIFESAFEPVNEKISQAVQVVDDNAYFTGFSEISNRGVYISIPKTTYDYVDPMNEIRQRNIEIKFAKLEPRWLSETRSKRLKEYNKCRIANPYLHLQELKIGSVVSFEGNDCVHKAKTGAVPCKIEDDDYENWVLGHQRMDFSSSKMTNRLKEDQNNFQVESTFPDTISDWDLVLYSV